MMSLAHPFCKGYISFSFHIISLSNTLANDYITTSILKDQLTDTYITKSDKLNFSVNNLEIIGDVKSSLYHNAEFQKIGNLDHPWLEGHFGTVFASGRRVMLEGDEISFETLLDKPVQFILPVWLNIVQEDIPLANFGGSLECSKITNVSLLVALPTWSSTILQSSVSLNDFGGQSAYFVNSA
jgi:hypothetical protein